MTFYNVISAVLFVGALRELLIALNAIEPTAVARAGVLALLVFNDAIYTSWVVEDRKQKYGPDLMLIDLANFLILSVALIALNSTPTNVFQLELKNFALWFPESRFWLLLGLYWGSVMYWTCRANVYSAPSYPKWLFKWALFVGLLFFIQSLVVAWVGGLAANIGTFVAAIYPAAYILGLRSSALSQKFEIRSAREAS